MLAQVRRFNRVVTQRVGALDDHYLARGRPLGEARVLWEIGDEGCDVRSLRSRLDLDSGYLSRLLRSLEAGGARQRRTARRRQAGPHRAPHPDRAAERAVLDRRSDELAQSFLEPLGDDQRARLVSAMADVERLLTAALVDIEVVDPARPAARHCLRRVLRRARPPLRHRVRSGVEHPRRPRRDAAARRGVPGRTPAGRAGRVRGAQVPRRRTDRAQAHVGCRIGTRPRGRPPPSGRARGVAPRPAAATWCGWRPTGRSLRPSTCTAQRAIARSTPSTTSPTPTTGSRSGCHEYTPVAWGPTWLPGNHCGAKSVSLSRRRSEVAVCRAARPLAPPATPEPHAG